MPSLNMPQGRNGAKVIFVAQKEMRSFERSIKKAAKELHHALICYEIELWEQNHTQEQIDEKVKMLMDRIRKEINDGR